MRLAGKVAIVTGVGQGIGRGIAERFSAEGARLVVVERDAEALAALPLSGEAERIAGDVTRQDVIDAMVARAIRRFGRLDILVNNAIAYAEKPLHGTTDEEWDGTVASGLTSVFRACRAALPAMLGARQGAIVNLASVNQMVANPNLAAYTAVKGGIHALTKQIAIEYGPHGIRCNAISPGFIQTPRTMKGVSAEALALNAEAYPVGRVGTPEDVAAAALFLASDEAAFITAIDLPVDGGFTSLAPSAVISPKIRGWWGRRPLTYAES